MKWIDAFACLSLTDKIKIIVTGFFPIASLIGMFMENPFIFLVNIIWLLFIDINERKTK